ncbi:tetratricopeptide repeat protein 12 [Musca vetustissima]|uniref:tetratricopeptide repeat protein 12 n=1 Tax=Musca vetustissima TaxID=27455 RepID=UPI002AB76A94|nr:tetratricopeptide repeat protein 12 [Musca vetustissima]
MNNPPGFDEDFLEFESKVNQVMKLLEDINNANKKDDDSGSPSKKAAPKNIYDEIDENNFIVTVKESRTVLNRNALENDDTEDEKKEGGPSVMDKFTFMQQFEKDADERAKARRERERIAQHFRTLGNEAFRKQNYEKAINMYTKAMDHIRDSPILYNNRALAYMKLKNYKRGIMDCDYVLNKLEEKNIRSWLYRAAAYKRLGDEKNFETSIKLARKNNPKKGEFIDDFLEKFKMESI